MSYFHKKKRMRCAASYVPSVIGHDLLIAYGERDSEHYRFYNT